jgi:hypothetical protein
MAFMTSILVDIHVLLGTGAANRLLFLGLSSHRQDVLQGIILNCERSKSMEDY